MKETFIKSRKPSKTFITNCPKCHEKVEFSVENEEKIQKILCYLCLCVFEFKLHLFSGDKCGKGGDDAERTRAQTRFTPVDTTFYDLLGIESTATPAEIKKAYYTAAIKSHPDKNSQDPTAESRFKSISEAYQVLSDPSRRQAYDRHGISSDRTMVDPTEFFKQQFGGEKFVSIIGEISIAKDFKNAMGEGSPMTTADLEARDAQHQQRLADLSAALITKLELYTSAFPLSTAEYPIGTTMEHISQEAISSFRILSEIEVDGLRQESYGKELLLSIGYTYTLKSDQWMAILDSDGGWLRRTWGYAQRVSTGIKEKAHIIVEAVGTVKTALELQSSFTKLQEMGKDGNEEFQRQKQKLEEDAATKGMEALWRGSKLEVESVLRQVCDRVMGDESVEIEIRRRRGVALKVLGQVYQNAE